MAVAEAETTEINFPEWSEYRNKKGLDRVYGCEQGLFEEPEGSFSQLNI